MHVNVQFTREHVPLAVLITKVCTNTIKLDASPSPNPSPSMNPILLTIRPSRTSCISILVHVPACVPSTTASLNQSFLGCISKPKPSSSPCSEPTVTCSNPSLMPSIKPKFVPDIISKFQTKFQVKIPSKQVYNLLAVG